MPQTDGTLHGDNLQWGPASWSDIVGGVADQAAELSGTKSTADAIRERHDGREESNEIGGVVARIGGGVVNSPFGWGIFLQAVRRPPKPGASDPAASGPQSGRIPHHSDPVVSLAVPESKAILAGVWPPDGVDTREGNRSAIVTDRRLCRRFIQERTRTAVASRSFSLT